MTISEVITLAPPGTWYTVIYPGTSQIAPGMTREIEAGPVAADASPSLPFLAACQLAGS